MKLTNTKIFFSKYLKSNNTKKYVRILLHEKFHYNIKMNINKDHF